MHIKTIRNQILLSIVCCSMLSTLTIGLACLYKVRSVSHAVMTEKMFYLFNEDTRRFNRYKHLKQQDILNIKFYKTGNATLLNKDFKVLYSNDYQPGTNFINADNGNLNFLCVEMKRNLKGFVDYYYAGNHYFVNFAYLKNGNILLIKVPASEVLSEFVNLKSIIKILILLTLILALFIAEKVADYIVKPIVRLTDISKNLIKGDYDVQINTNNSTFEINNFAIAFEQLVELAKENHQKEILIKSILNNLPFMAWMKDLTGKFLFVNETFLAMHQMSLEDIVGKTIFHLAPQDLASQYQKDDLEIIETKSKRFIEEQIIWNNEEKWYETYKTPVLDKTGQVVSLIGFARDITDKKESELEFLLNQEQIIQVNKRELLIQKIVEVIRSSIDINEVLAMVCDEIAKLFNVQRATIVEFPDKNNWNNFIIRREFKARDDVIVLSDIDFDNRVAAYSIKKVIGNEQSFVLNDIQTSDAPDYFKNAYKQLGVKAAMCTAIKNEEDKWGMIFLSETDGYREWTNEEVKLLEDISNHIYIAIKQAELYSVTKKQAEKELLLREIVETIRSSLDINKVLTSICDEVAKAFAVQRATIIEFPDKNNFNNFIIRREFIIRDDIKGILNNKQFDYRVANIWAQAMYEDNDGLLIDNIQESELPDYFKENYKQMNQKSIAIIPIECKTDKWGVIILSEYDRYRHWTRDEVQLLKIIADQVYTAIKQAQLHSTIIKDEKYLRTLLENIKDGILILNDSFVIEACNKAILNMFEYNDDEIIGKKLDFLVPYLFVNQSGLATKDKTFDRGTAVYGSNIQGITKNTKTFPVEIDINSMDFDDKKYTLILIRDITQRNEIDKLKNEFVSMVSHELRTPLTSIRGALGLVSSGITGALTDKSKELVDIANNNSQRLINLINDILDIEKIEAGKMDFNMNIENILPIINQTINDNIAYAQQYKVSFELENLIGDAQVKVDKVRLIQVITNLLSNAAKFSHPESIVKVKIERINNSIRLSVTNYNYTIPEEFRSRIFNKFAQADSSDKRQKGGTGLGLNITKALIENMAGNIDFVSNDAEGTTFFFDLPEYKTQIPIITPRSSLNTPHILICEDDKDVALLIKMLLSQENYTSDIAYNAIQAKKLLSQHNYDALTLDLILPDENGLDLIKELRSYKETENLPIIVVSVNAKKDHEKTENHFAVIDWIDKPINSEKLIKALKRSIHEDNSELPKVLHIEDDVDVQTIIHSILKNEAKVYGARNLQEAKNALQNETFDLVILDITLPDGNGIDLLPLIKRNEKVSTIIFSTNTVDEEIVNQVDNVLLKSRASNQDLLDILKLIKKRVQK